MDTQFNQDAPKVVSLQELETRRAEFEVPSGAIEALKAGSSPVMVFLRSTGEEYMLADREDTTPARTTDGPTDGHPDAEFNRE
ncbi:MAG: hypothetical protein ACK46X_00430 [Candidatus Sericytochromatia bacterium]